MRRSVIAAVVLALAMVLPANALAASPASPAGKTTICHMSSDYPYAVTITVSDNSLPAHWRHGDYRGTCVTTITLAKAIEPTTDTGKFDLWLNGTKIATDIGNGYATAPKTVGANSTNAIAETAGTGTSLGDYTPSWSCTNGVTSSSGVGSSGTVTARAGRNTVCTFWNTRKPATVQFLKNTDPPDSSLWGFVITNGSDETYDSWVDQSTPFDSGVLTIADPTAIEIDEWAGTGTDIAEYAPSVSCTDNGSPLTPAASTMYAGPNGQTFYVYFPITQSHAYVCTFTNKRLPTTVQFLKSTDPADSSLWNFGITNAGDPQPGITYQSWADQSTPFDSGVITIADPSTNHYIQIDEWAGTGTDISDYTPSVVCTDNGSPLTPGGAGLYDAPLTPQRYYVWFPIQQSHAYVCTFTNTKETAPPVACNQASLSGGEGTTVTTYELGQTSGTFDFYYNTYSVPDSIVIAYMGNTVFTTNGPVSVTNVTVPVAYGPGSSTQVTVTVVGPPGTVWDYIVYCPNT